MGALPTAKMQGLGRAAARSMDTKARVTPRSLASAATSASDMKQCTSPPSEARIVLLIPALAIWVSVTMSQPARRAAMAFCTAWSGKGQIVHIVKIRRGVDDPFDDQLILRIQPPVTQQLGDDGEAALLDIHRLHLFRHSVSFLQAAKSAVP